MGSPAPDCLSNNCATTCDVLRHEHEPEVRGQRVFVGRFQDDKCALVRNGAGLSSEIERPQCMRRSLWTHHCPLKDTSADPIFCRLQFKTVGNKVLIAPSAAKSIVPAKSAMGHSTRRAVANGVFVRLRQCHNGESHRHARKAVVGSVTKLLSGGYRARDINPALAWNFPDHQELSSTGPSFSAL